MPRLMETVPHSPIEPVTEVLHGVSVTDPYRWLEDQGSRRTREWLAKQTRYARSYFDGIPGRERIHERVRQLLDVETYDSIAQVGSRYFFRKRLSGVEQPCIFCRDGEDGKDQLLIDPADRQTGKYTAVRPLRISHDGSLLLYEVKEGGERTGTFELLDVGSRRILPDILPRGYLRGFAFTPDSRGFYYSHEPAAGRPGYRALRLHTLGTTFTEDEEVFRAGANENVRLHIVEGEHQLGLLVLRFLTRTCSDFYLIPFATQKPEPVLQGAEYKFGPVLVKDSRILAITDCESPNLRIVEVHPQAGMVPTFTDVVASSDVPIQSWIVTGNRIFVSYLRALRTQVEMFDTAGNRLGSLPLDESDTTRMVGASDTGGELFLERESFTKPIQICCYEVEQNRVKSWAERTVPFESEAFRQTRVWFTAKDGMPIPMFLVGQRDVLACGSHPTIMTSYGGFGVSMTPQFSSFAAFLIERGCLFALPNIRGGSEFGVEWHKAARGRNRQVAFDDFLSAAEWLVDSGRADPHRLALFGGSNSGLLVGAAMTQRPDLFRAVVCMVPMLDMLRYHLFDRADVWKEEFGIADDPTDFSALFHYSPYHKVRDGVRYPAIMIVSGDSDQNCNPLHARKMTARLQAANDSDRPVVLDYSPYRGHSPVLPLSERIAALTDRMAFLCDQLQLPV
jgi:prolyl oligopeptidase